MKAPQCDEGTAVRRRHRRVRSLREARSDAPQCDEVAAECELHRSEESCAEITVIGRISLALSLAIIHSRHLSLKFFTAAYSLGPLSLSSYYFSKKKIFYKIERREGGESDIESAEGKAER